MIIKILLDLVIVGILVAGVVLGIRKGFVKTVARPVRFFASVALAFSFCDDFARRVIEPIVKKPISARISDYMYEKCSGITADNVSEELPTLLKMAAGLFNIDVAGIAKTSPKSVIDVIIESLTTPIIHIIAVIASFFIVYFLSKLLITLLMTLINSFLNSGLLGIVNKSLGLIFGSSFAFIIAWSLVVVVEFMLGFIGYDLQTGIVYNFMNGLNPVDLLLSF